MFKNVFDKMYKVKIYEMCAVGKTMIFLLLLFTMSVKNLLKSKKK